MHVVHRHTQRQDTHTKLKGCVWGCVHECSACGGQRGTPDLPETGVGDGLEPLSVTMNQALLKSSWSLSV